MERVIEKESRQLGEVETKKDSTFDLREMLSREECVQGLLKDFLRIASRQPISGLEPEDVVEDFFARYLASDKRFENIQHLHAFFALFVRHQLIDRARKYLVGPVREVDISEATNLLTADSFGNTEIMLLLDDLEEIDPIGARIAMLRAFGGFTLDEIAEIQNTSRATVKRHWTFAKDWLRSRLQIKM